MRINELEKAVLSQFLMHYDGTIYGRYIDFEAVTVTSREFTGAGFLTDFQRSDDLKLWDDRISFRWGKIGAWLNDSRTDSGYLIYINDGYLATIEGYTYGEEWPDEIISFELHKLD